MRNEIPFGYNASDDLPASTVLTDGYSQCNTKTTPLMALLRGSGIPCRFHGATIHKKLQKGVVEGFFYRLAPVNIIHSRAEVRIAGSWFAPGGPLALLCSSDLGLTVQVVRDAGGEVVAEPYDFPGGRRFHFKDPSGNELGVWSPH